MSAAVSIGSAIGVAPGSATPASGRRAARLRDPVVLARRDRAAGCSAGVSGPVVFFFAITTVRASGESLRRTLYRGETTAVLQRHPCPYCGDTFVASARSSLAARRRFFFLQVRLFGDVELRRDGFQLVERHLLFLEILLEQLDNVRHPELLRHVDQPLVGGDLVTLGFLPGADVIELEQLG